MSFGNKWTRSQSQYNKGISERVKNKLSEGIEEAQKKLQIQISKLDAISIKMNEKDKLIFNRVVHAVQNHDGQYAKLLSNELSQVRRMSNMVDSAKLALEQIQLRLNTLTELGDVVVTLSPAMSVIKGIQGGVSSMMPQADQSFEQISTLLGNIMSGTTNKISSSSATQTSVVADMMRLDDDAVKIMEEAVATVAEDTRSKFPDLLPPDNNNKNSKRTEKSSSMYYQT